MGRDTISILSAFEFGAHRFLSMCICDFEMDFVSFILFNIHFDHIRHHLHSKNEVVTIYNVIRTGS